METIYEIASQYRDLFLGFHLFAMVIGLGGATYTDIILVSFLKDKKIDKKESEVIHTMSKAVTIGVFLALISGIALFLANPEELKQSSKFLAKVIIFFILMINGFFLHRVILPRLIHFDFSKEHYLIKDTFHLRQIGFVLGAISAVSWYSVFILGTFSSLEISATQILAIYVMLLIPAITIALFLEQIVKITHKK